VNPTGNGGSRVVIGQGADCDVRVEDPYVSTRHCQVWQDEDGQAWLEDLGSTNGTWVGGVRVYGPTRIGPGVVVHVGHTDIPWTPR
jgi:pSer/pThr/pTyr-binding forkhead associated (FHA) protein